MSEQKQNFVSNARQAADRATATIKALRDLREAYEVMGYAADGANPLIDADLGGENASVTAAQIHAAMAVFGAVLDGLDVTSRAAIYGITVNTGGSK